MILSRVNKKIAGYLLGKLMLLWSVMCLIPTFAAYWNHEAALRVFIMTVCFFAVIGFSLTFLCRNYEITVGKRQGQIIVGLIWILIPLCASLPYMFFAETFSVTDALFESFSGFTTTGSTVIEDLSKVPVSLLVYRSMTQWVGGLGFTLLIIASLSKYSGNLNNLFNAEFFSLTSGKMYPHLKDTVKMIFFVYSFLTIGCFVFLFIGEMDFWTTLSHSFSIISTGGFSTSDGNIGSFSSYSQWVIMCFMFLSGISFFIIIYFFRGKFKSVFKDEQLKYYTLLILFVSLCFVVYWTLRSDMSLSERIKDSLFYSVSMVSSTGYDLQLKAPGSFVCACLLLLMIIGGCSASSSTGLKIIRVIILVRYARTALTKLFHPHAVVPVRYNGKSVREDDIRRIFGFFFLYAVIFVSGIFILSLAGNDFSSSIAVSAANLGNIGPVVGEMAQGFSYSSLNTLSQFTLIVMMLLGRLEIYSFLALFSKSFYKKI